MLNGEKAYKNLKTVNQILSVLVLILGIYLCIFPFLPEAELKVRSYIQDEPVLKDSQDRIVVSKIFIDTKLYKDEKSIDKGPFFIDKFKYPDKTGTKVIAGHRFQYIFGSNTFYHLDKLSVKDEININWQNETYNYQIVDIFEVQPNELNNIFNKNEDSLFIYTCTPIWTAKKRLVIKAIEIK